MRKRQAFDEDIGVDVVKIGRGIYKANKAKVEGNESYSQDFEIDEK